MCLTFTCAAEADGKYRELERCIFSKADTESHPPKKHNHWAYVSSGFGAELMRMSLTEQMDDIISMAMELLSVWPSNE